MINRVITFDLRQTVVADMVDAIRCEAPELELVPRQRFRLLSLYVDWMRMGRKHTTIRIKHGAIDYPSDRCLPLVSVDRYDLETGTQVGWLCVDRVVIKPFRMLTNTDAIRDGFANCGELIEELNTIYGPSDRHELVTIYETTLLEDQNLRAPLLALH